MPRRPTDKSTFEHHRNVANKARDTADEVARINQCDDPLHPWSLDHPWHNWIEFIEQVAEPLVNAEAQADIKAETQRVMRLYRTACPYSICVMMTMAYNRLKLVEMSCRSLLAEYEADPEGSAVPVLMTALADNLPHRP